ncbi:MAG: hypothetical protein ACRDMZ_20475, partial [Solirubrobacteraceae bacterium]
MSYGPAPVVRAARSLATNLGVALVAATLASACGGGSSTPDAPPDTPPDMASGCGADLLFTGEIVDWDSVGDCGVANATVTV